MNQLKALENVFAAEVEGRLPFQSKAKIYEELEDAGLVESVTMNMHGVKVEGYVLTHAGRIVYCNSCTEVDDD